MAGKRDPSIVVAIWATVSAIGGALITTGGGLLTGLLTAGSESPKTTVTTVTHTETVTVSAPPSNGASPAPGTTTPAPGGNELSLRELPAQGTRYFTYGPQTVAGIRYETVLNARTNQSLYRRETYIAPADRGTFRAVIGLVDGAPPEATGTFTVLDSKNKKVVEKTVLAGKTDTIEAVVGRGQQFSISVVSHTGPATLAWINPVLVD